MTFLPQPQGISQICELLLGASSTDNAVQRKVHEEINRLSLTVPELPCYFAHILSNAEYEKNHLRIYAGYALKSYLHLHFNAFQASTLQFVQNSLLQSIQDGHPQVASLAGTLASYLLQHLPSIDQWPEVISHFAKWISEPNQSGFSAALKAVQQLCEDSAIQLIQAKTQPLTQLLPPLMNLIHSNDLQVIVMVIRSFAELASLTDEDDPHHYLSQLMENMFHPFLQTMLAKANVEPHLPFQQALCYFIVKVCQHNPERLFSHLDMVLHYILHCTQSENVELAMEASEFWICMAEHPGLHGYIHPFLPQLLPTLFQRLVYSQEELMELGDLNHVLDAHVPDSDQTIKPRHYRGKHHEPVTVTKTTPSTNNAPVLTTTVTTTTNTSLSSSSSHPPSTFHEAQLNSNHHFQEDLQKGKKKKDKVEKQLSDPINEQPRNTHQTKNPHDHQPQKEDENDNDDDEDEDDDEDSEDVVEQWTLRKCSAATLDILASVFENELLSPVLPLLKQHLIHPNWLHREAGILALGAMAEGCAEGLKAHLPELVPYLIKALNEELLIRSISCWTLSRFAEWILFQEEGEPFKDSLLQGLLQNCTVGSKKVQQAACVSLAIFLETGGVTLQPYLPIILPVLVQCFQIYQKKNLLALYDCLGTLANAVGNALNQTEFIQLLLPPLFDKWHAYQDTDRDLLAFFECMASIVVAFGLGFHPYSKDVLTRCFRIINGTYEALHPSNPHTNNSHIDADPDFYIVSLDLIAGIIQGLGHSSESLVQLHLQDLLQVLKITLQCSEVPVKQSAIGLFGELILNSYLHFQPYVQEILTTSLNYIHFSDDLPELRLCSNVVWVSAELTDKLGEQMVPFIPLLVERVLPLFEDYQTVLSFSILENLALALGRYGLVAPELMAKYVMRFAERWLTLMMKVKAGREKEAAFLGFIQVVSQCASTFVPLLPKFLEALVRYPHVSATTENVFRNTVLAFHGSLGNEQWHQCCASLHPHIRELLLKRFGV